MLLVHLRHPLRGQGLSDLPGIGSLNAIDYISNGVLDLHVVSVNVNDEADDPEDKEVQPRHSDYQVVNAKLLLALHIIQSLSLRVKGEVEKGVESVLED